MASESTEQHRQRASEHPPARVAVMTVSDTRTPETDVSGTLIRDVLHEYGQVVVAYMVLPDEPEQIRHSVEVWCEDPEVDAILITGGTGISRRDGTYEVVTSLMEKTLPGFGELFRGLSWQEVGPAAMLSRAVAGIHGTTVIFSMPGSTNAVEVAMEELIAPELAHLVWELKRKA